MQVCPSGFFRRYGSTKKESLNVEPNLKNNFVNSVNITNMSTKFNHKKKHIRRKRKGHIKHETKALSFLSCNVSSIQNKLLSLEKIVNDQKLSFFALQETHVKREGSIKFMNSKNYHIFEHIRLNKYGGGLALGILKELNPFWIPDGGFL